MQQVPKSCDTLRFNSQEKATYYTCTAEEDATRCPSNSQKRRNNLQQVVYQLSKEKQHAARLLVAKMQKVVYQLSK